MELSDFLKLRVRIHQDFKHWFSLNRKHRVLYCDWYATNQELTDLNNYVDSFGFMVFFVPSCHVSIVPKAY